ncbi:MAG: DNA recombination protein RmuC [Paludibacteraceae bacterium]|nr:DNA recombination protein RmuC [Paludibacteraceae bacterium]
MEILLGIIVGIILGAGGAIVAAVAIIRREKSQRMQLAEELLSLRQEKDQLTRSEATIAARLANAEQTLQATKELHEQNAEAQRQVFQTELQLAREGMRAQFEKEMQARTEQLKKANTENMQQVVDPLKRELDLLRELVAKSKESSDKNTASLAQSIRTIIEHDQARDKTTQTLANALKNRGKVQGDWGEQVLTNILHDSGLREGEEYFVQDNVKDEEGKNLRPDVIVKGADGTRIIIDSKVSLTAYSDYVGAEDDEQRKAAIKANHESIWKHVEELAKKNYAKLVDNAVPIVLMFVPNEGSYILAMNHDASLGSKAYQKGVLIINPTNLMVVLRLIFLTWQNTRQEKNYEAIRKAAAGIYEKYTSFAESYVALGRQIDTARNTYEKGVGQLREGRGNLSSRLESLLQYGVTTTKHLPTEMTPILGNEEEHDEPRL